MRRRGTIAFVLLAAAFPFARAAHAGAEPACQGGTITLEQGSKLDTGWTGIGHDEDLAAGASFAFLVVKRCSDSDAPCFANSDCASQQCLATCDCSADTTCEIAGPIQPKHCATTLADCSTNADCPAGVACVSMLGPPLPLSFGGTPVCIVNHFEGPLTGTADFATGDLSLAASFVWQQFLGIELSQPCPRCGPPEESPAVGGEFTCEGGQFDDAACRVDAVTPEFGGTSFDCPPTISSNITGPGQAFRLNELTTGTSTKTAQLPCASFGFNRNPLLPGSNPKCVDKMGADDPVCASNADCKRCSGDSTIACAGNDDCNGHGTCAEAPDQSITCGFWCQCGFCDGNGGLPCFENGDCPAGQQCEVGPGLGTQKNAPQQKPNDCSQDHFVCGQSATEECATTTTGTCGLATYRACTSNQDCDQDGTGVCDFAPRHCFESRIERTGSPSPLGEDDIANPSAVALFCMGATSSSAINSVRGLTGPNALRLETSLKVCRCGDDDPSCEAVCSFEPECGDGIVSAGEQCEGGPCCEEDCQFAHFGTACRLPVDSCDQVENCDGSSSSCPADVDAPDGTECHDSNACTANDTCTAGVCAGIAAECGNGTIDANCESCDDGNTTDGDGCSSECHLQQICGDADDDGEVVATDAQLILRKAVGVSVECPLEVCDVDASGAILANDALRTLRHAVGLPAALTCDYQT